MKRIICLLLLTLMITGCSNSDTKTSDSTEGGKSESVDIGIKNEDNERILMGMTKDSIDKILYTKGDILESTGYSERYIYYIDGGSVAVEYVDDAAEWIMIGKTKVWRPIDGMPIGSTRDDIISYHWFDKDKISIRPVAFLYKDDNLVKEQVPDAPREEWGDYNYLAMYDFIESDTYCDAFSISSSKLGELSASSKTENQEPEEEERDYEKLVIEADNKLTEYLTVRFGILNDLITIGLDKSTPGNFYTLTDSDITVEIKAKIKVADEAKAQMHEAINKLEKAPEMYAERIKDLVSMVDMIDKLSVYDQPSNYVKDEKLEYVEVLNNELKALRDALQNYINNYSQQ